MGIVLATISVLLLQEFGVRELEPQTNGSQVFLCKREAVALFLG